jgi:hypothetical protein
MFHDPDEKDKAMAARSRGGSKGEIGKLADIKPPRTEADVLEILSSLTIWVIEGKCDSKRADTIVKLCKTQLSTIKQRREQMPERSDEDLARMTDAELRATMEAYLATQSEE